MQTAEYDDNAAVGIVLWAGSSLIAFGLARIVPAGRRQRWLLELAVALLTGLLLGVVATALDFGGWKELDWRAGAFVFFGSFAALGALRALQSRSS